MLGPALGRELGQKQQLVMAFGSAFEGKSQSPVYMSMSRVVYFPPHLIVLKKEIVSKWKLFGRDVKTQ